MIAPFTDVPLEGQIQHFLTELGWNWSHPRLKSWIQRCGFSHYTQLSHKAKLSLVQFLFEFQTISYLMACRGLGSDYLTQWMADHGYSGVMPLKGYTQLRTELEALEDEILF